MDAQQLLRMVAEHGPAAKAELEDRLTKIDSEREEIVKWIIAIDDAMRPALSMTPKAGILQKEEKDDVPADVRGGLVGW